MTKVKKVTKRMLEETVTGFDAVIVRKTEAKFGREYYYRHGQTAKSFSSEIKAELDKQFPGRFELKDCGDHWAAFKGGASLWASSHFWAVFSS